MSETAATMTTDVAFSDAAAKKVKQLIAEEKNPDLKLRIYISGGGCSGFQYGFSFDEKVGVSLLRKASSAIFLGGRLVAKITN